MRFYAHFVALRTDIEPLCPGKDVKGPLTWFPIYRRKPRLIRE
jgi:hypothetical protein